jgi:SPX domain protein involved in polyphosphate accumulation
MKFGKFLAGKEKPEWKQDYLDYKALKDLIEESVRAAFACTPE